MTLRKKKIFLTQLLLFIIGLLMLIFTYLNFDKNSTDGIFKKDTKVEINKNIKNKESNSTTFYNITYSGIDLSGNRYILQAKEAKNGDVTNELLKLKNVKATFYFKNDKMLNITSNSGFYNNKTLDMIFENEVNGKYDGSILLAEKAEYFNSKNILIITDNVRVKDPKGVFSAEKLLFDIKKNTLNISSSERSKVKADINYK
tara:strand:- start:237 stop:842 length:606 start_codon:yes stop_codon:yes gene_type:complete